MKLNCCFAVCIAAIVAVVASAAGAGAAELEILLPLDRTAYQTNEGIDLSVVRQSTDALSAGDLAVTVAGDDGSKLSFVFAVPKVAVADGQARRTEHLQLAGWLLRPGHYKIDVAADGATASTELDVYSHIRRSSFRLINWSRAQKAQQIPEGEDSLGFNMFYGSHQSDVEANSIRAGMDYMCVCTMGGGHQMDLRSECDWSDPYVTRGGTQRVVQRAFINRTRPNVPGVHFFDEPGMTWHKHPVTGEMTPHGLPSLVRLFKGAFGREPIPYYEVNPENPDQAAQWRHWALWKLSIMDAAWKEAQFGVSYVRPDFISANQSQYGFSAFADGYYFNVARCLPVVSGHGGYDDYGCWYFNPSYFLEVARARDWTKPCWYLPTWYGNTPSERFRLEQNLSFMTNVQGMISPPDIDPFEPAKRPAAEGVVESNHLMARLGTIFTTMPVTRPPVAMLYSMSQNIREQTKDRKANYTHSNKHGVRLPFTYLAGKILQMQFLPIVEEDVVDGSLAAAHKAIVLTSIDYLDPKVVAALEAFAQAGGLVLMTADCQVKIRGGTNLGVVPDFPEADLVAKLRAQSKWGEMNKHVMMPHLLAGAIPLARAIKTQLDRAGIGPVFICDQPGITATRQATGDVEYLFAVNATYDEAEGGQNSIRAAEATIGLEDDGRPVYDAVLGGPAAELEKKGGKLSARFRFGPGQMRVFARTARPIGRVAVAAPVVLRDYTKAEQPLSVELSATVLDDQASPGIVAGSIPLRVQVIDPAGAVRYDLYRAATQGALKLSLPLAANDPPGSWKVAVSELLANKQGAAAFKHEAPAQCGAMMGAKARAVAFGNDRDNVFRFFRVHHDVTLVLGKSDYNEPAARRLTEALLPWGVRCKTLSAADVNHPRKLSAEETPTWSGLEFGRISTDKDITIGRVGFDIQGPVVLLGTAADNPLIEFIQKEKFLPYQPDAKKFPGAGRGMIAWQRDAVGKGQESITLLAYDAAGMAEAVGTLYEAMAGLEPLTRLEPPGRNSVAAASAAPAVKQAAVVWQAALPDRAAAIKADAGQIKALTWDGSAIDLDAGGRIVRQQPIAKADMLQTAKEWKVAPDPAVLAMVKKHSPANRIVKHVLSGTDLVAVAYWGGTLELLSSDGQPRSLQLLPQDVTGMVWLGKNLIVGLADGRILALAAP